MYVTLIVLSSSVCAALAALGFYLGSRNQRLARRSLSLRTSLAVGGLSTATAIALLAVIASLPVAVFSVVLLETMILTGLPFLRLLPAFAEPRR